MKMDREGRERGMAVLWITGERKRKEKGKGEWVWKVNIGPI
jgi:hypothetical protein